MREFKLVTLCACPGRCSDIDAYWTTPRKPEVRHRRRDMRSRCGNGNCRRAGRHQVLHRRRRRETQSGNNHRSSATLHWPVKINSHYRYVYVTPTTTSVNYYLRPMSMQWTFSYNHHSRPSMLLFQSSPDDSWSLMLQILICRSLTSDFVTQSIR